MTPYLYPTFLTMQYCIRIVYIFDCCSVSDVSNGVCLHELAESKAAGPLALKRVTEVVSGDDAVFCSRCADESNFDNGSCVCTPDCGSCDDNKDIDTTQAGGVACVDLKQVVNNGLAEGTQIFNAGAVKQGGGYGGDCRSLRRFSGPES